MTTVRDIIKIAMQRAGILGLGRDPRASEAADALIVVQGFYDNLMQGEFFGGLTDVYATDDATANEFERITTNGYTITLPTTISDPDGTRTPRDTAIISLDGVFHIWDGEWRQVSGLSLDSYAPLSSRGSNGLACAIARDLADTYQTPIGVMTAKNADSFLSSLCRFSDMTAPAGLPTGLESRQWYL